MASFVHLTLDTKAPEVHSTHLIVDTAVLTPAVKWSISASAPSPVSPEEWGMQVMHSTSQTVEPTWPTTWETYKKDQQFTYTLPDVQGLYFLWYRFRDDVGNMSTPFCKPVRYDKEPPVVTVTKAIDPSRVSCLSGHRSAKFSFTCNEDILQYITVVAKADDSKHGTQADQKPIHANAEASESKNLEYYSETIPIEAGVETEVTIDGRDLQDAARELFSKQDVDGQLVVKVFARDVNGNWSEQE